MASEWTTIRAADFIDFNPHLSIKKGALATKVAMDKLQPFTKKIPATEQAEFAGGSKFCNGDTIMARITPCLENGKTAFVDILADGEVAFGSTGNVKKCAVGKYPKSEKPGGSGQAACCACAHSLYFTGGSPSGLRV